MLIGENTFQVHCEGVTVRLAMEKGETHMCEVGPETFRILSIQHNFQIAGS